MRRVPVPEFRVPSPPGQPAWAVATAVILNVAVVVGLVWAQARTRHDAPFEGLAALLENPWDRQVIEMVYLTPLAVAPDVGGAEEVSGADETDPEDQLLPDLPEDEEEGVTEQEEELPEEELVPLVEAVPTEAPTELSDLVAATVLDSTARRVVIGTRRRLGPSYADGRIWAPIVLSEGERAILAVSVAAIDSVLRDRIIAQIRQIPPDSFAMQGGPQEWATTIAGQSIGIDQQFITLGPLKIPTFLLAFLPLNLPDVNIFDQRDKRRYEAIRQQIIRQSQTMADSKRVKEFIAEMRERIDEERARRRAGVVAPVVARDTIIPGR